MHREKRERMRRRVSLSGGANSVMPGKMIRKVSGGALLLCALLGLAFSLWKGADTTIEPWSTVLVGQRPLGIAVDGRMSHAFVVNNLSGDVDVLDTRSGAKVRTFAIPLASRSEWLQTVAVDTYSSRVFAISSGPSVRSTTTAFATTATVLDTQRGRYVGAVSLPGLVKGITIDERRNHDFVLTDAAFPPYRGRSNLRGALCMLNATTGALLRITAVGVMPIGIAVDRWAERVLVIEQVSPSYPNGLVRVFDARTGGVIGTTTVGKRPLDIAVDERTGHAFVTASESATIAMLDTRRNRVVASTKIGGQPVAVALDTQLGHVFVTNAWNNTVSMLDARNGRVLRTERVGTRPLVIDVDTRTHRVFVANQVSDTATVLDATTGATLYTVSVGLNPTAVAIDEAAGHAFILNINADGPRPSNLPLIGRIQSLIGHFTSRTTGDSNGSVSILDATR